MIGMEPWRERELPRVRPRGASPTADRAARGRGEAGTWWTPGPSRERRSATVSVSGVGTAACLPRNPPSRTPTVLAFSKPGPRRRIQFLYSDRGSQERLGRRRPSGSRNGRRLRDPRLSHDDASRPGRKDRQKECVLLRVRKQKKIKESFLEQLQVRKVGLMIIVKKPRI